MSGRFMTMKSPADFEKMKIAGTVVAEVHAAVREAAVPGVTLLELDAIAHEVIRNADCRPSFLGYHGFPASICANMDAWLKTHVAKILATAGALYYAGGHAEQLAANHEALQLMVRAMREGLDVLRANDIPITPSNHRVLRWLPEWLMVFVMKRMFDSQTMAIKVGHAEHAHGEFELLAQEFRTLNAATRLPTPAMDRLNEHLAPTVVHELAS